MYIIGYIMKSNHDKTDTPPVDAKVTWTHLFILVMTIPPLYLVTSLFVLFIGGIVNLRQDYAYYFLYGITAIIAGVLGVVYIPTMDTITATTFAKGMIGGWVAVFVYILFAFRIRTVSGIGTQVCENASLFGTLIMPSIVAGLSGWLLYETITDKQ